MGGVAPDQGDRDARPLSAGDRQHRHRRPPTYGRRYVTISCLLLDRISVMNEIANRGTLRPLHNEAETIACHSRKHRPL
jgi:hypothetical protein